MRLIRNHWFDWGLLIAVITSVVVFTNLEKFSSVKLILWLNFIFLLLHQFEEYRFPGTFPFFFNKYINKSPMPDRYPLNTHSAFIINVLFGWIGYLIAIEFGERIVLIGMMVIFASLLNFVAHVFIANIKAKTFYNPGMATSLLLFLPLAIFYFMEISKSNIPAGEYLYGAAASIAVTAAGIIFPVKIFAEKNTPYVFDKRKMWKD